jgi:hypothetical protein
MSTLAQEMGAGFEQCVVFVEHVTGVGYNQPTAASYLTAFSKYLHTTPQVGDIAIWGANQGGALGAGHVALVTSISPSGSVNVTGTNWPEGSGAVTRAIGTGGMGVPTAYLTPSDVGGTSSGASGAAPAPDVTGGVGASSTFAAAKTGSGLSLGPWNLLSGSALRRTGFTLAGLALVGIGLLLLLRRDIPGAVAKVAAA